MPRVNPRLVALRHRKARRKLGLLLVALLLAGLVLLYLSGLYLYPAMAVKEGFTSARIQLTPGNGFPAPFSLSGYLCSQPLSDGSIAALGDKDLVLLSPTGRELRRIQHGFVSPGISAAGKRVCLYYQGGNDYTVEGRTETMLRRSTEQELLFTTLSESGWLAVVTSSRYRATLEVYSPVYEAEPHLTMPLVDEKPVLATFHTDNKNLVLATLSAKDGALGTTLHFLRTDRDSELATLRAEDARILQAHFLSQNRLLAVYDTYAATYSMDGEELARYSYGGRSLLAANVNSSSCAMVFGTAAQETQELALLDTGLDKIFATTITGGEYPRVLTTNQGVLLLHGREATGYARDGTVVNTHLYDAKPLDLVAGREALVLTVTHAEPAEYLLKPGATSPTATPSASTPASTPVSTPPATSPASGASGPASTSGSKSTSGESGSGPENANSNISSLNPEVN